LELIVSQALLHQKAAGLSTNRLAQHIGVPESTLRRWKKKYASPLGEACRLPQQYNVEKNVRREAANNLRKPLRSSHRLAQDLEHISACPLLPETRRLIAVLDKWFAGLLDYRAVISALERR